MGKKILDIEVQHDINTFLYESLPICIITAKSNLYEWFLGHYVNLHLASAKKNELYSYYRIRHTECIFYNNYSNFDEVISTSLLESRVINNKLDIVDFLKVNIDNGSYAIVFLNEWAIPHKRSYHKDHWYHESLVYGYDDEKSVIYCISFNENQIFTSFEVDYHSFLDGFQLICNDSSEISEYQRYVQLLKPTEQKYTFSMAKFAHHLDNFINSTIDLVDQYNFDLIDFPTERDDWEYTLGYKIYDKIIDILQNRKHMVEYIEDFLKDFRFFEYFDFHILYEHKKLMLKRFEYINKKYLYGELDQVIKEFEPIVEAFNNLRFLNIKFNQTAKDIELTEEKINKYVAKVVDIITNSKDKEREIFKKVYNMIKDRD